MDYYANPPLMMVEFGAAENNLPSSPLGSPPSTPQHQPSLFFAAERNTPTPTSSQQNGTKPSDDRTPQHLLQPTDDEDIPMDELRHYHRDGNSSSDPLNTTGLSATIDDDGPDDEKMARHTITAISPSSNMQIETKVLNPPTPRTRTQPMSSSQRLAYNRSNSGGRMRNGDTNTNNGFVKNGSVKNIVSKYETSPMMKTPEKDDLLSPPKLLLKKTNLWQDSPATGSRLPPSSSRRLTTRDRSRFKRAMNDDEEDVPDDERPTVVETDESDIPEDERMAMMSTSASAAAKERFARSSGRNAQGDPQSSNIGLTTSLSPPSEPSIFAGELTRKLEVAQTQGYNRQERADLHPTTTPMNGARSDNGMNQLDRSSPRRPAPRRLNYDGSDDQQPNHRDDSIRSRAEILQDSTGKDPTMTQNLRRLRLSEDSPSRRKEELSPSSNAVPVYPPRVSSSLAASLKSILDTIPKTHSLWDLKTHSLVEVPSLESYVGIAKGDLTLSVLPREFNSSASLEEESKQVSGADRVQSAFGAIGRARDATGALDVKNKTASSASPLRPPQPVDADDVIGMHEAALSHLLVNDIERAMGCYREILSLYKVQKESYTKGPPSPRNEAQTDFELSMSLVVQNLGILNLLKKKYFTAMTYFSNALETRMSCLIEGHVDQVACLAKMSICQCALDQFDEAQITLRKAVDYAKKQSSLPLTDRLLLGEMMNNLGTLHCRKGMYADANECFAGCLKILESAVSECLYEETLSQSVSLNISIARSNAGFSKMAAKDFKEAIPHLEKALLALNGVLRSGDEITVAVMDCLAAANLLSGERDRARKMYARMLQVLQNECAEGDPKVSKTIRILEFTKTLVRGSLVTLDTLEHSFAKVTTT